MSGWAKKRFWDAASVEACEQGFAVLLDGRAVKTPAKAALIVPTEEMAKAIAEEWDAQQGEINPASMPVTRSANAAIDKVSVQHAEVADMLAEYGGSDLLCYRATSPEELIARQAAAWDPILEWAATTLGTRLQLVSGVMHHRQDPEVLAKMSQQVHSLNAYELAAFHDLVSLTGSLVLGFAAVHELQDADALWRLSRVDEDWQQEQWGVDDVAAQEAQIKYHAFLHACRFFKISQ